MPELPEVETIRRGLSDFIVSQKISEVEVRCDKSFIGPVEVVTGRKIVKIRRKGKALLVDLSGGVTMMIHLRMTGQLVYRDREAQTFSGGEAGQIVSGGKTGQIVSGQALNRVSLDREASQASSVLEMSQRLVGKSFAGGHPTESFYKDLPDKQTRVIFALEKGKLYFNDQRKFGFVKVLPTDEVEQDEFIASLGPEPWEMSAEKLYEIFQRRKGSPVKGVILDQKVMAGIGNIYADEALFDAKVHPARTCGSLSLGDARRIIKGACKSMDASIESGGSTMATYVRADGTKGDYLEKFAQVFRREGKSCPRCGCEIEKIRVAGRGTHICPHCQRIGGEND